MTVTMRLVTWSGVAVLAMLAGTTVVQGDALLVLGSFLALACALVLVRLAKSPNGLLLALLFVIATIPVLRVVVAGAPVYAIDVLVLIALVAIARQRVPLTHFGWLVVAYLVAWVPAWAYQMITLDLVREPTYGLIRNVLAVSAFFVAYACARRPGIWERWTLTLAVGVTATAALALLQTADVAAAEEFLRRAAPDFTSTAYRTYPDRAFAFFAAPTVLAGFFAFVIPMLVPLLNATRERVRATAGMALVFAPLGALATYSRQWVPALAVGLAVLTALRVPAMAKAAVVTVLGVLVAWAFLAGGAVDQSYLEERFDRFGPTDVNVRTRIDRQQEFLTLVHEQPSDFVVGKGFAGQDIVQRGLVTTDAADELREGINDNVFFLEVVNHGAVAGLLYLVVLAAALFRILGAAKTFGPHSAELAGIGAALATALVLHLLDNYFSEAVFMKMLLWATVGLGVGLADQQRHAR